MGDYEEKYKQALENAKQGKSIEEIFPELAESEDERIRNSLIGFLKTIASLKDGETVSNEDFDSEALLVWADWLEKQGEQKPVEWSEEDKSSLLSVKCVIDEVWHNQDVREEIDHSGEELESLWHWLDNIWQRVEHPQNHWKPSKEQIGALNYAYCELFKRGENGEGSNCVHPLSTLIDDLRKL